MYARTVTELTVALTVNEREVTLTEDFFAPYQTTANLSKKVRKTK
jgi:hypothetical protein